MTVPPQDYLRTLDAIRDRSYKVYEQAQKGKLVYFDIDETKLPQVVQHVQQVTRTRFGTDLNKIPPHSRLNHFGTERLASLRQQWQEDKGLDVLEQTRRFLDLVVVSVLVDAGAGQIWSYTTKQGERVGRSEGLAIASLDMFLDGYYSSDPTIKDRVDAQGLKQLSVERIAQGFQVSDSNPMAGLEGRSNLLKRLADILTNESQYFEHEGLHRPGNLVDYLLSKTTGDNKTVQVDDIWQVVMSLAPMWPARITIEGVPLGDVWPCTCLDDIKEQQYDNLVPFHKLSQWLTYSLIDTLQQSPLDIKVNGVDKLTGLPEYRNGGLLVDDGLLTLKPEHLQRGLDYARAEEMVDGENIVPLFDGNDPLIVEWRALTVVYLDRIHRDMEKVMDQSLSLAQVLEAGTWTAGREIAKKLRPKTGGPPIAIKSDGTIF
ncbi:uncharacterized protein BX664DRAFT_326373 [Halteromyces radiatus]|uniref:uncharacterized protein n=1 Tax=Halteromyces radiatus TaxID=101107 RepID=UPI00221F602E|nr:uncharacterized protein BX664DRAFT_326373 [Halteromyces radiatus]KAI8097440.1 hypothetical protein BX664DRAFT_326373 [Halteromyces radiatus]